MWDILILVKSSNGNEMIVICFERYAKPILHGIHCSVDTWVFFYQPLLCTYLSDISWQDPGHVGSQSVFHQFSCHSTSNVETNGVWIANYFPPSRSLDYLKLIRFQGSYLGTKHSFDIYMSIKRYLCEIRYYSCLHHFCYKSTNVNITNVPSFSHGKAKWMVII